MGLGEIRRVAGRVVHDLTLTSRYQIESTAVLGFATSYLTFALPPISLYPYVSRLPRKQVGIRFLLSVVAFSQKAIVVC